MRETTTRGYDVQVIDLPERLVQLGSNGFAHGTGDEVTLFVGSHVPPHARPAVAADLITRVAARDPHPSRERFHHRHVDVPRAAS